LESNGGMTRAPVAALLLLVAVTGCAIAERTYEIVTIHPPSSGFDVNRATPDDLATLPGLSEGDAERIVRARPYEVKADLLRRGVVSNAQYAQFQARVYVGRVSEPGPAVPLPPLEQHSRAEDDSDDGD
jgi:hypothetical protein